MIVPGVRQLEFWKQTVHVFLDGALGHEQAAANPGVRVPLGHKTEHLALAPREIVERVVPAAARYELLNYTGVNDRSAAHDPLDNLYEVGNISDPTLQQVTDSVSSG